MVGDEHDLAVGYTLEVLAVRALAVTLRGLHELAARDPTVLERDRLTVQTPSLQRTPCRKNLPRDEDPRKETTNFVARFRFSGQISNRATFFLPKCGFPPIPYPPNRFFRHFSATTGVHDVARFQKTAENGIVRHLGTQNVPKRPEACNHRKKNASKADSPFFPYILMRFIREEPRVPETSPISMKLVMFCWAISTQSSTTQLPSNCSGSDCST